MSSVVKKFILTSALLCSASAYAERTPWISSIANTNIGANLTTSLYTITSISGSSQVIETEPDFSFPVSKLYTFKLCLSHPTIKFPFKGQVPYIEGASVPLKAQILDNSCLAWNENINFYYTAPARYVTVERTLNLSKPGISENIPFQFAINPWLHGEPSSSGEIADFIKIKPRNIVNVERTELALGGKDKANKPSPLIVNDARVNFQELGLDSNSGGRFLFDFRTNPQIELTNSTNQSVYLKLSQGEFEFEAYLISTLFEGSKQIRRIVNQTPFKGDAHLRDNALAFIQEITLESIPSRGRLELAVILKPKQHLPYLKPFKGIYILGDYTDLKANFFARLKTGFSNANHEFNFEDYIGLNGEQNSNNVVQPKDGLRRLKYEFEPLLFKLTRIGEETATTRQVYYQVRACVRNGTDNSPLRGYHFTITKDQKNSEQNSPGFETTVRPSEYDSCIYWDDRIDHKIYAPQKYFRAEYRIQNSDLNLDETLAAYINPWDIMLSRDARTIEAEKLNEIEQIGDFANKAKAFFFIPSYKVQTRTIQYSVDPLLRLSVHKQVHLLIEPQILNYSNISKGIDSREPLRDGVWKIRWGVLHNRYESETDPFIPLAHGEFLALSTQGRIVAPLDLEFHDFRYIESRNYLMLEIAPVKPDAITMDPERGIIPKELTGNYNSVVDLNSGLMPQTFIGPLIAGTDDEIGYMVPHPQNPMLTAFVPATGQTMNNESLTFEQKAPAWDALSTSGEVVSPIDENSLSQLENSFYLSENAIRSWNLNNPVDTKNLRRFMGPSAYTLKYFSNKYQRDLFKTEMLTRALQQHKLTAELEDRLCYYFFDQNPYQTVHFKSDWIPWRQSDSWLKSCLQSVRNPMKSFFLSQIESTTKAISNVEYLGSTSSSLAVGASFSIGTSESAGTSASASVSTGLGVNLNLSKFISLGANASYGLTYSESQSQSTGNGISVSTGVTLNVRKLLLKLTGTLGKQCLTVGLNPALFSKDNSAFFRSLRKNTAKDSQITRYLMQRVRLCYSNTEEKTFQTQESFYLISQDTPNVGFIDTPDIRNRPFLLQLRGTNTYANFLRFIAGRLVNPQKTAEPDSDAMILDQKIVKTLQMTVPGFPGVIVETVNR